MQNLALDLYEYYRLPRPAGAAALLRAWHVPTDAAVSTGRRKPAVLILPGGAYRFTSAREAEPVALRFAAAGWAAFVLDYSCAPHAFPVALREAALAMRYIRGHAAAFEADPGMVAAMGFSAGGHLCGTLGTLYDAPEVADIGPAALLRPDALALCYPVTVCRAPTHAESIENVTGGDPALKERLSLEVLVRPDMPPVFLWHTRDDASVPCCGTLAVGQALCDAGVDFALHIYRHGEHGLSNADATVYPASAVPLMSRDVPGWFDAMLQFFGECGLRITDAR